ncbi:arsenate reductase (glutaredoxin) [Aliiroseovarius crassostreae]|uniref:arsenate reductase (glutaredoxin) n=1 Tax=Aliiroseovarius crassostreae TaxID=154981 RepID=UPI0021B035BE|nr:arsenate reductase (glutaredoxin) [Aliiroseovarius crassostreae]UWQ09450.1 arsenate reductase (glutaredoxin) [Aliiroseovarius crassostreae]UWQ12541.1 arsenate reductase (glutaredoxin) [Aliiroseovarius crassostreae]
MAVSVTIWHNPRCSKSRQTLALVEERTAVDIRKYLDDAPNADEIRAACAALGLRPIDMMRKGEKIFKELDLSADMSDDDLIAAMAAHPILIERPIVFANQTARIGRPPESVLDIL